MPYDNDYNRMIADLHRRGQERYIALHPLVMMGNFQYGNANKEENRKVPEQLLQTQEGQQVGGSGFAEGTYRDTGFDYVDGASGSGASGGAFQLGDLGDKNFWNKLTISQGSGASGGAGGDGFINGFKSFGRLFGGAELGLENYDNEIQGMGASGGAFQLGDLGDANFWKKITISGGGLHTPHRSGCGIKLGDLMDSDFWKKLEVSQGKGMSGGLRLGDLTDSDFYKNINVDTGLKKNFKMSDLADANFWKNISLKQGSGKHLSKKMGCGIRMGDLLSKDFWNNLEVSQGKGMSGGDAFTDFFKSLGNADTYKNIAKQAVGVADTAVSGLNQTYNKAKSSVGLGKKTQEILPDYKAEKGFEKEMNAKTGGKLSAEDYQIIKAVQKKLKGKSGKVGGALDYEGTAKQKPLIQLQGTLPPKANLPSSSMGSGASGGKKGLPPALQKWKAHLDAYRKAHPECSLKQAMMEAKKTYKK
jgi:hypothetical protein